MPAPNLGLVGARGVGALQYEIQKMEAERRAAEQLAYKRQQDEQAAAELGRHRQALEQYQLQNLDVNRLEARNRMDALAAAQNKPPEPVKPTVHSGLKSADPAKSGKFVVGILPDGTRVFEYPQAEDEPNVPSLGGDDERAYARFAKRLGREPTQEEENEFWRTYTKASTREPAPPRPWAPYIMGSPEGVIQIDRNTQTATPVRDASGKVVQPQDTAEVRNRQATAGAAKVILDSVAELSAKINTGRGVAARISGTVERAKAEANLSDDVSEYQGLIAMNAPLIARALGRVGVLTEQDEARVLAGLPRPEDSQSVATRKVARLKKIMDAIARGEAPREEDLDALDTLGTGGLSAPIVLPGGGSAGTGRGRGAAPPVAGGGATSGPPVERWEKDPVTGKPRRVGGGG